ncbi:MAG: hypothetical protein P4M01_10780 [Acidobacteriota bacterium]|nr:hypothetical protein [Acidobacteriota bacterium]
MFASAPDADKFRVIFLVVIALITILSQVIKQRSAQKPTARPAQPSPRDAWRQAMEQIRARRQAQEFTIRPEAQSSFPQPAVIRPESPIIPSLLLLALVVAVAALVYRALAG